MVPEPHVKLFRNGRNQAVRIPRAFELQGADAIMRKEGNRLIIEAAPARSLLGLLARLTALAEALPAVADPAPDPVVFRCGFRWIRTSSPIFLVRRGAGLPGGSGWWGRRWSGPVSSSRRNCGSGRANLGHAG